MSAPRDHAGHVAGIFDDMAGDYDDLRDPWYAWLFSRLHYFIARDVFPALQGTAKRVLDMGCGTGFQSYLLASIGAEVLGVDIAEKLIDVARSKGARFRPGDPLFPEHYDFVRRYNAEIRRCIDAHGPVAWRPPRFAVRPAESTGCTDASCDAVICCGSVLSLVDAPEAVLAEMARVLRPGGVFVLEAEARYNADLVWSVLDAVLLRGGLGYDLGVRDALRLWRPPMSAPVMVDFPFGEPDAPVPLELRLFPRSALRALLRRHGLAPAATYGIHAVTNVLPSPWLDTASPSRLLRGAFGVLAYAEERLPAWLPGASVVMIGRRL